MQKEYPMTNVEALSSVTCAYIKAVHKDGSPLAFTDVVNAVDRCAPLFEANKVEQIQASVDVSEKLGISVSDRARAPRAA